MPRRLVFFALALFASGCVDDAWGSRGRRRDPVKVGVSYPDPFSGGATARSLNFDGAGSDDSLSFGDWDGLEGKTEMSAGGWFNLDSVTSYQWGLINKVSLPDENYDSQFFIGNLGNGSNGNDLYMVLYEDETSGRTCRWVDALATGWQHVLVTVDLTSQTLTGYVDGSPLGACTESGTWPTTFRVSDALLGLGESHPTIGNREPDHRACGVGIWDVELSAAEVAEVYNSGSGCADNLNTFSRAADMLIYAAITSDDDETSVATFGRDPVSGTSTTLEAGDISSDVP